jgi:hypothetical protein
MKLGQCAEVGLQLQVHTAEPPDNPLLPGGREASCDTAVRGRLLRRQAYLIISLVLTSSVLLTIAVIHDPGVRKARAARVWRRQGKLRHSGDRRDNVRLRVPGRDLYSALALVLGGGEAYAVNTVFSEHIGMILAALTIFNIV